MHPTAMNRLRESGAVKTFNCLVELARFGPSTPKRARRPFDASVDPTEARSAAV
jgi:hypothetical protein